MPVPECSRKELRERTLGLLLSLCIIALFIVWVIQTPVTIRYGVTIAVALLIAYLPSSNVCRACRLKIIRNRHVQEHVKKNNKQ